MRNSQIFCFLVITAIVVVNIIGLLSFAWTVIPPWQKTLEQFQWAIWSLNVVIAIFVGIWIFSRTTKTRLQSTPNHEPINAKAAAIASAGGILTVYLLPVTLILFVMAAAIYLKNSSSCLFYCSERFTSIELAPHRKTVHLMQREEMDGYLCVHKVYVQTGNGLFMKEIDLIPKDSLDRLEFQKYYEFLRNPGSSCVSDQPMVLIYHRKTGEIKITEAETGF